MKRLLPVFVLFFLVAATHADTIAKFRGDFKDETPAAGWEYLWNATGEIGKSADYKPLVWYAPAKQYAADATKVPQPLPAVFVNVGRNSVHPGAGAARAADKIDRYAIAAYTVPVGKSGHAWLAEGSVFRSANEKSQGYDGTADVKTYVNDELKHSMSIKTEAVSRTFDVDLGNVKEGDKVYVAVGPEGNDIADAVLIDYCISLLPAGTKPQPAQALVKPAADQPSIRGVAGQPLPGFMRAHEAYLARGKKGDIDVVFLGDSITQGWGNAGKEAWKNFSQYKPVNFGIGGDQTQNVLWRIANGEFDNIKPKVVVLMIGTNNSGAYTVPQIAAGITAVVNQLRAKLPETKVLLLGVFPRSAKAEDAIRGKIKDVNQSIAKLDDGSNVRYLDIGEKFLEPDGSISKEIMPDFLHLTPKGYERWAESIKPLLDEMMK